MAEGTPGNGGDPPPGYKQGADGRVLAELPGPKKIWKRGSHVNASWAVIANHGGGYQYLLRGNLCVIQILQFTPLRLSPFTAPLPPRVGTVSAARSMVTRPLKSASRR